MGLESSGTLSPADLLARMAAARAVAALEAAAPCGRCATITTIDDVLAR